MTHGKPAWYDIEMRGRRLEAIHRRMTTEFWLAMNNEEDEKPKPNIPMAFAYLERITKLENVLQPYVEQITGLNRFLKKHERERNVISV